MERLGDRNYTLISRGVKMLGSYDPSEILPVFEEELYVDQIDEVIDFLTWVHQNDKTFGSGNYEEVFEEYKKSKRMKTNKDYKLKQVPAAQGLNSHREWVDEISGKSVYSNDDVLGDKFYLTNGEGTDTVWYPTPTEAIRAYIEEAAK